MDRLEKVVNRIKVCECPGDCTQLAVGYVDCSYCRKHTLYNTEIPFFCSYCGSRYYFGNDELDGRAVVNVSHEQAKD